MDCVRDDKEFSVGINLIKFILDNVNLFVVFKCIFSMIIKIVVGIYWYVFKLLFKWMLLYIYLEKS